MGCKLRGREEKLIEIPKRLEKGIHYAGSRQSLPVLPLSTAKTSCRSSEPVLVVQGPGYMATLGLAFQSVPEIQEAESVTIPKSLLVAPDRAERRLVGRQHIHRGKMEKDRLGSHGMKPC
jgi:hypothetical protein